jgi:hypothetical protein
MRNEGVFEMTASERVLAIRLMEKQRKNPEYFEQLGIHVSMKKVESSASERGK